MFFYLLSIIIALTNAQMPCSSVSYYGLNEVVVISTSSPTIRVSIMVDCTLDLMNVTIKGPSTNWIGLNFGVVGQGMAGMGPNKAIIYRTGGCGLYDIAAPNAAGVTADTTNTIATVSDTTAGGERTVTCSTSINSLPRFNRNDLTVSFGVGSSNGLAITAHTLVASIASYTLTYTTMAATTMAGTTMAGTTMAGTTMAGTTMAGTTMAGTTMAGTTMAGTTMAGMTSTMMMTSACKYLPEMAIGTTGVRVAVYVDCMYDLVNFTIKAPTANWVGLNFGVPGSGMAGMGPYKALIYSTGKMGSDTQECAEYDIAAANPAGVTKATTNTAMTTMDTTAGSQRTVYCSIPIATLPLFMETDNIIAFGVGTSAQLQINAHTGVNPITNYTLMMGMTTTMDQMSTMSGVSPLTTFGLALIVMLIGLLM